MNFIKKIFNEEKGEDVHLQFQKFSRGEFKNRALISVKKSSANFTINTTSEFANDLVKFCAERLGEENADIKGVIVSTSDLTGELEFEKKKQFMGIKQYIIEREMSGREILGLIEKFPKVFFGLSFDSGKGDVLKIKAKAPKSAKPKTKEKEPKADFCKLKTNDLEIVKDFIFERDNFKKADVRHDFIIEEIIIPEELKKEENFAKAREMAIRKGKILRHAIIDNNGLESEKEFEA